MRITSVDEATIPPSNANAEELVEAFSVLTTVDLTDLRNDLDAVIDPSL